MSDPLVFHMGNYEAVLPTDRRYCRNHMWAQPIDNGRLRFGFSAYAVRLMKDVYFLDWSVNEGDPVALKQPIGNIESSKAESELYAPLAGMITSFNQELLKDPSGINVDAYGIGWLFVLAATDVGTMSPQEYHDFLAAGWENTQRILKGQL